MFVELSGGSRQLLNEETGVLLDHVGDLVSSLFDHVGDGLGPLSLHL